MDASDGGHVGFAAVLRIRGTRRLIASAVVARMPQGMMNLAALLLVHAEYHSFAIAGLAVGGFSVGLALAAPVQGSLVDRHGARRVVLPLALGQAIASVAFALCARAVVPAGVLVLLAVVAGTLVPPISATMRSVWMRVIADPHVRDAAFALDAMTTQLVFALGPLATAAIIETAGPAAAVAASGLVTLAGTLVFATAAPIVALAPMRVGRPIAIVRERRGMRAPAALRSAPLRAVLLTVLLAGFATGSLEVGLPALAVHLGSKGVAGVLLGLWAFGAAIGGWGYGRRRWGARVVTRLRLAAAGVGCLTLPLVAAGSIPVALVLSFIAGLPWAALYATQYGRVGETAPAHAITEAFTWNVAAIVGGAGIGSAVGGALISALGATSCFVVTAAAAAAIIVVARQPAAQRRSEEPALVGTAPPERRDPARSA